jgi:hypothetical protein
MSLILERSDNISCSLLYDSSKVFIGTEEIDMEDFLALVHYVFTNSDLRQDDPRRIMVEHIKTYVEIAGYNRGGKRFCASEGVESK